MPHYQNHFGHGHHGHPALAAGAVVLAAVAVVFGLRAAGAFLWAVSALFLIGVAAVSVLMVWVALAPSSPGVTL